MGNEKGVSKAEGTGFDPGRFLFGTINRKTITFLIAALILLTLSFSVIFFELSHLKEPATGREDITRSLFWLVGLAYIFLLMMLLAMAIFANKKISTPVRQLQEAAKSMQEGNFKARVSIKTGDELEELGVSFNKTIEAIERVDTERKQLDRAKTEFLSITSHELRSPMTPMKAQLQMLLKGYYGKLNTKQKEAMDIVLRNTERLDNILVDFLEISRIEAARLKFRFIKTDLSVHVRRLVAEMKAFMPEKKIEIVLNIGKLPVIEVDPDRVMQVLRNLINNAIKFSQPGSKVIIDAGLKEKEILFSVQDSGVGMSQKDRIRLFEPFYQVEHTFSREHGGTGLGLAICKGIVESQDGRIWVESILGKGSKFHFTVPLKPVREMKPIKILFSQKEAVEREAKEIFRDILGPIGEQEFEDLKAEEGIEEDSLSRYISLLTKKGVLDKEEAGAFKKRIGEIFEMKAKEKKAEAIDEEINSIFK